MVEEPCEPYHVSHPTPCWDCKKRDDRRHELEAELRRFGVELAETQDILEAAKDELHLAGIKPKQYPLVLSRNEYKSRLQRAEARIKELEEVKQHLEGHAHGECNEPCAYCDICCV